MLLGEVPLLGFEGEEYGFANSTHPDNKVLFVPVPKYGMITIYAWNTSVKAGEGYNIFFPYECPVPAQTVQARDPLTVKLIVTDYLQRYDHFIKTGELLDDPAVQRIPA